MFSDTPCVRLDHVGQITVAGCNSADSNIISLLVNLVFSLIVIVIKACPIVSVPIIAITTRPL